MSPSITAAADADHPRFYIQSELVRGERRLYWIVDRSKGCVSTLTTDKRQAERWLKSHVATLSSGNQK